jgi:GPH family glycoside/pentoside/hexuronide:cation symporter
MCGVFPGSESFLFFPFLFGSVFAGNAIDPVMSVVADSQLTDICDDHELKTGVRAEGVVFSVRTFAMKATAGLGGLIGGIGLEIIGFPQDAGSSELAPEVVNGLLFISGPFYFSIFVVGALFMWMYRLNEKGHAEILTQLEERRGRNPVS